MIHTIHGFNVSDGGASTVGKLAKTLRDKGHKVNEIKYGYVNRLRVRACNKPSAKMLASMVTPGDHIVAHSNGAAIVYEAARAGAKFGVVMLINPALDVDRAIMNAEEVIVLHAPSDPWTRLARLIPFSAWGRQGAVGYKGTGSNYRNMNMDKIHYKKFRHSGVFHWAVSLAWISRTLRDHIRWLNQRVARENGWTT